MVMYLCDFVNMGWSKVLLLYLCSQGVHLWVEDMIGVVIEY